MITKTVGAEAREYVYDLQNCASEYGFSSQENWQLA